MATTATITFDATTITLTLDDGTNPPVSKVFTSDDSETSEFLTELGNAQLDSIRGESSE